MRYSLPGNEIRIDSGLITRAIDGELSIMNIATPFRRMRVITLRKGESADAGPWMNRVTPAAKKYLLELGTISVQLSDDSEIELKIQDCKANGELPRYEMDEAEKVRREIQRTAERAAKDDERRAERNEKRGRQLVLTYDLPPERLGRLYEEKELDIEVNLIRNKATGGYGGCWIRRPFSPEGGH